MKRQFPDDFWWGLSTSSYQLEGAVQEDGRGPSIWDTFAHTPGKIKDGSNGDVACDHYHRYAEDVQLLADIGVNAYCFSVAWPRVIPDGDGAVNPKGLDFYDRLVDALLEKDIIPVLKLYHWDLPQALQDKGGWGERATAEAFARYAAVVAKNLGDRVKTWITHNELWCTALLGHQIGLFAPGIQDFKLGLRVAHHVLLSHGLAVPVIRQQVPGAQVGVSPNFDPPYPATDSPDDQAAAQRFDGYFNRWFLDPLAGRGYPQDMWDLYGNLVPQVLAGDLEIIAASVDFLGVNYYNCSQIKNDPNDPVLRIGHVPDTRLERTADREIRPEGLYDLLVRLDQEYDFPALVITENGSAWPDVLTGDKRVHDSGRVAFMQAHQEQAARAVQDGVPLKGYFFWSLMDNFEWAEGYTIRYGICYVDYATQERIMKDSALWYQDFLNG